jgi:transcriptional regulator with XRE-family HTH domain
MRTPVVENALSARISARLAALRAERGWTLEELATRTEISRASLSRLERGELSPTAAMLTTLCAEFGWTLSRLMADAEGVASSVIRHGEQMTWKDPQTGYTRRLISPPCEQMKGELLEIEIPAGAVVSFDGPPMPGLEHHLWILSGALHLTVAEEILRLERGDSFRYRLFGTSRFQCEGNSPVRYLLSIVRP